MKKALSWLFFFGAVFCIVWYGSSQMRNIRAAQHHAPIVAKTLSHYPEFNKVRASFGTAHGGVMVVIGDVTSQRERTRLKRIVMATNPPVKVDFAVRVRETPKEPAPLNR